MDLNAAGEFTKTLGFPIIAVMFGAYMMVRRRPRLNGHDRSSYLVAGWQHDNLIDEYEDFRSRTTAAVLKKELECDDRIQEFRDLYEAEHTIRKELEARFIAVNAREVEQTKLIQENTRLIHELRLEIAESRKRNGS